MRAEPSIYETINASLDNIDPVRRFGKSAAPIAATETYRRVISTLIRDGIRVEKWILINNRDHTVTFITTYNGIAGAHYDATQHTEWLSLELLRSRLEAYQYVPADECPVAMAIGRTPAMRRQVA